MLPCFPPDSVSHRCHRIQIYTIIKRFTVSTVKTWKCIHHLKSFWKISTQFRIIWFNSNFFYLFFRRFPIFRSPVRWAKLLICVAHTINNVQKHSSDGGGGELSENSSTEHSDKTLINIIGFTFTIFFISSSHFSSLFTQPSIPFVEMMELQIINELEAQNQSHKIYFARAHPHIYTHTRARVSIHLQNSKYFHDAHYLFSAPHRTHFALFFFIPNST